MDKNHTSTASPPMPPAVRSWLAPAALLVIFFALLGGIFWLFQVRTLNASRAELLRNVRTAQEGIRLRLHATRDHLATLAEDMGRETITESLFRDRISHYMADHPELVSAMFVDAGGKARWAVPAQWEEKVLGRPLACPRSLQVCADAAASGKPVYSDIHISLQNEPAFDLCVPVNDANRSAGAIVGIYSCDRLLRNMLPREIVHKNRASLVDAGGNTIVSLPAVESLDERLVATIPLDPPGQAVALRLDGYGSGLWGIGMTILAVLCAALALGVSGSIWSLNQQVARRAQAERLLREARDQLADRVRERTAELEDANHNLTREIAERHRAEQDARRHQDELAHVARVSTMGQMATGLAHELNQPLGAIASFAEGGLRLIESRNADQDTMHAAFSEVASQARRAGQIIQRLRSFVANGHPKREPHRLHDLVAELMHLVENELRQQQIDLQLDLPESIPLVLVDGIQTQQVLVNLLHNAMEALENPTAEKSITLSAAAAGPDEIVVSVADTGPGCPPDAMAKIFDAFFTTKDAGIGMGLSISRSIVEAHGGRIWAETNPRGGLIVRFTLPTASVKDAGNVRE